LEAGEGKSREGGDAVARCGAGCSLGGAGDTVDHTSASASASASASRSPSPLSPSPPPRSPSPPPPLSPFALSAAFAITLSQAAEACKSCAALPTSALGGRGERGAEPVCARACGRRREACCSCVAFPASSSSSSLPPSLLPLAASKGVSLTVGDLKSRSW
jgi:hypothetical protein